MFVRSYVSHNIHRLFPTQTIGRFSVHRQYSLRERKKFLHVVWLNVIFQSAKQTILKTITRQAMYV